MITAGPREATAAPANAEARMINPQRKDRRPSFSWVCRGLLPMNTHSLRQPRHFTMIGETVRHVMTCRARLTQVGGGTPLPGLRRVAVPSRGGNNWSGANPQAPRLADPRS